MRRHAHALVGALVCGLLPIVGCTSDEGAARDVAPAGLSPATPEDAPDPQALDIEPQAAAVEGQGWSSTGDGSLAARVTELLKQSSELERYLDDQIAKSRQGGPGYASLVASGESLQEELREVQAALLLAQTAGDELEAEQRVSDLEVRLFRIRGAAFVAFRDRE